MTCCFKTWTKTRWSIFWSLSPTRDVAFLLLTLGGLGIVVELFNPGLIAPGVVGAILLILAFLALGNLPVNWAGVVLIALALALAVLETQVAGFWRSGRWFGYLPGAGRVPAVCPIRDSLPNLATHQRQSLAAGCHCGHVGRRLVLPGLGNSQFSRR